MIVFSAIVPHSPLLLPTIGKEHRKKLKKTVHAYKELEEDLYASKPDTIVIISPHGSMLSASFPLFISQKYQGNLKEFGDSKATVSLSADLRTIETLRRLRLGKTQLPLVGLTDESLDYGSTVPLHFLTAHLPDVKLVVLGVSYANLASHFEVGKGIGDALQHSTRRIALIGSADLSHTLTDDAPGGFSKEGKKLDEAIVQALRKNDHEKMLGLEDKMEAAKACGLRVITLLLGMLNEINATPEPLSYEGPFGVGYLTARFNFR